MAKTNAEKCKDYYYRKKGGATKKIKKTGAERTRACRLRKKLREQGNQSSINEDGHAIYLNSSDQLIINNSTSEQVDMDLDPSLPYSNYHQFKRAHEEFKIKFLDNSFGHPCSVCDRLWFQKDLKSPSDNHKEILSTIIPNTPIENTKLCNTCVQALNKKNIPNMSTYNGFEYPDIPQHLPKLDLVSERLILPRIPFMQIRRLRNSQYGICGQIINLPVSDVNTAKSLPRNIEDDCCINVHIKRKKILPSTYLHCIVDKRAIKSWLQFLISSPLYIRYDIKIDDSFFNDNQTVDELQRDDFSEHIAIEESLTAQQQTLLWNEEQYLNIAPGNNNIFESLLFDKHAEELSFPSIYLGQFRNFRDGVRVTPFMMASSELRRSDRRAVTPYHLLYLAMKIMRLRVHASLTVVFKYVGKDTKITKKQIEDIEYVANCLDTNLAFLRAIPNSSWYWMYRKKDLFAMIRQFGKPTVFLTVSANEIKWNDLLQMLYKFKHNGETISEESAKLLHYFKKTTLVNEDAVTCAIYFNKLVNVVINILKSPKFSPFGKYYVVHYFKRIQFQHRGSPHAHILLWLDNAPLNTLDAITLIDKLISVSSQEASGNIKLQRHKHTFTCYKKTTRANQPQHCRFEAPFMPCRSTTILLPLQKEKRILKNYAKRFKDIRINLEKKDYTDIDSFYKCNNINSDDEYYNILRAGIKRPRVFVKRQPNEKWHNPFNPFILNIVRSNMDIQFITEEYSCANYVIKTERSVSHLQQLIIEIVNENPEFDLVELTKKMGVNMLNSVEITSQEAAWYLLREPLSKCSTIVATIQTMWPVDRQRIRKTQKALEDIGEDLTNIWKENWFDKYETRHQDLQNITLAQFVAYYTIKTEGNYTKRKVPRVIRYRNYDMEKDFNEYKREMVTLHIPFRSEDAEILAGMKFIDIYNNNEDNILNRRKEFEFNLDIQKTIEISRKLCGKDCIADETELLEATNVAYESNPFQNLYNTPLSDMNTDNLQAILDKLGSIAKKRDNLLPDTEFYELMRMANDKQKELLLHVISNLLTPNRSPLQIFFTGPAGSGKTFVIKIIMEIYNRYTDDAWCNSYIVCASTGKAAFAIGGSTVHTALKISTSRLLSLTTEVAHQYRALFQYVKVLIIDEISMIGAELFTQIDSRLKQITGDFDTNFGGIDIILIGDLRQLPPVRATLIYKQQKRSIVGPILWRAFKFYELDQVIRQANQQFSSILTKIGNGQQLEDDELMLLESRFFNTEEAEMKCPHGIRLFYTNKAVTKYNNRILSAAQNKTISIAKDVFHGCTSEEQKDFVRQKLYKMSLNDTGGLPYETVFVPNVFYMITTNIDVSDGLANGTVGKLVHIERNDEGDVSVVWLDFPESQKIGLKIKKKVAQRVADNQISKTAVPIGRRSETIPFNNNKTINVKRWHVPLVCACATTIHKSQGSTYPEVVYEYDKTHELSLVYVALTRVTSLQGLYITTKNNDKTFYHGRGVSAVITSLQDEFLRLSRNRLLTISRDVLDFIHHRKGLIIYTFNCQSLRAHSIDLTDSVIQCSNVLLLSETWLPNGESINIPNFNSIIQYKRSNVRAGGVAIYQNANDTTNSITPNIDKTVRQSEFTSSTVSPVGEFCVAECRMEDGKNIALILVYITPNQKMDNIISFLKQLLWPYTTGKDNLPMILSGDFNVNFSREDAAPLIAFLQKYVNLTMNNDPRISTTQYGTTIDGVFTRHLGPVTTKVFISYFSYHKPLITNVPIDSPPEQAMAVDII